jgi:hypothetical protein
MRLYRQKAFLFMLVSGIACSSSTGPETVSAFFTLRSIDGRALPTYIAATPGPSATVISSSLTLYTTGKAVLIEHRDEMLRGNVTDTTTYAYTIHSNQLEIHSPSPCLAIELCPLARVGTISPFALSLVINPSSPDPHIVYEYRSIGLD